MALLELKSITKEYILGVQTISVLKGIHLEIEKGQFVSIMGQSGSGKSTLMNIIGMLDVPTSGSYFFDGQEVGNLSDDYQALVRRQSIWFIFQSYNLLSKTPALRQVSLPLGYQGIPKSERDDRAYAALKKVGLEDKINNLPTELSWGQQQRVAIARAIVTNPSLILADEPTGALDSATGEEVMELLTELNKEGKTIVIITHAHEVDVFAKTHINIKDGRIVGT